MGEELNHMIFFELSERELRHAEYRDGTECDFKNIFFIGFKYY